MSTVDTAALRTLLAKATPGEWKADRWFVNGGNGLVAEAFDGTSDSRRNLQHEKDNAALIAALHNAAPALLDAADRWAQVVAMREELHRRVNNPCSCGRCFAELLTRIERLIALIGD